MFHCAARTRSQSLAVATATGAAVGFLPVMPVAQAEPLLPPQPCDKYVFNGEYRVRGSNGWTVSFNSNGEYASGPAEVRFDDGGRVTGEVVSGRVVGNTIQFTIRWENNPHNQWNFWGRTSEGGHTKGEEGRAAPTDATWYAETPLACATPPAAQLPPVEGLR
ncbi:hypothetical protein [Mycolicibacterium agri]|uniref:Uncharacterized protein n=2 Tax=Mycolicibacterium agri TaxID=36811 RepID=A0A7I9VU30_MYCAG|nr:hypothetical protein [Mycolicibacterium agri]GFG48894.1 hypothetical protein MAGR_03350 [Mycolicibacterium agri]